MPLGAIAIVLALLPSQTPRTPVRAIALATAARAMQPGEVVLLTITTTGAANSLAVRAFDVDEHPFQADAHTWRALIGIDLDVKPATCAVTVDATVAGRIEHAATHLVVLPKKFPTRTLKVDDAFVNPPTTVTARIEQEAKDLAALWTKSALAPLWTGAFARPVAEPANSAFGSRSVFNGQARSPHAGADFLSPAGTPVKAPAGGRVVLARDLYYSGNTVIIDHGLGLFSFFAHFSAIGVHDGDEVKTGEVLGRVGATGRVTGPHLHWAVRLNGARVDPLSLLAVMRAAR
jgi:murein DD-endopeptidase MepM/ murein hydrolase activator NlpD